MSDAEAGKAYRSGYNPAFLAKVRAKAERARIEAKAKEDLERARLESEAREKRRKEYLKLQAEIKPVAKTASELDEIVSFYKELDVSAPKLKLASDILKEVSDRVGIPVKTLLGASRNRNIVFARHFAIWVVHNERPDLSLPTLGRIFNRDHTTILHALRKMEAQKNLKR